jgi:hypothetical protein
MSRDPGAQSEIAGLSLWSCPAPYRARPGGALSFSSERFSAKCAMR